MKKRINNLFKRFYVKYLSRFSGRALRKSISESEKISSTICRKLINHPDSKFLIAPISGKRYIKNNVLSLFVLMDGGRVSITNHVYHYDVVLNYREWDRLSMMYDNRTERDRLAYEKEIHSQIEHSLQIILEKINENEN